MVGHYSVSTMVQSHIEVVIELWQKSNLWTVCGTYTTHNTVVAVEGGEGEG